MKVYAELSLYPIFFIVFGPPISFISRRAIRVCVFKKTAYCV